MKGEPMGKNCPNCGKFRWGLVSAFLMQSRSRTCPTCGICVKARCSGTVKLLAVLAAMILPGPFLVVSAMLFPSVALWVLLWAGVCLVIYAVVVALGTKVVEC